MNPRNRTTGRKGWPDGLKRHDRKSGVYYYWIDPRDGKERSLKAKDDFQLAKRRAKELNALVAAEMADRVVHGIAHKPKSNRPQFKRFIPDYLEYCEQAGQAKATIATKRSHLNEVLTWYGDVHIDELTVKQVNDLMNHFIDQRKPWRAHHIRSVMIDVYRHAYTTGDVDLEFKDPVSPTRQPKIRVKRSRLTMDTLVPIMDEARKLNSKPWVYNSILLALVTGQRVNDLTKVRFKKGRDWDRLFKAWIEADHHESKLPYSYVTDTHMHMVQSKRNAMVKIPLSLRLDAVGLSVGDVVKQCRDRVMSKHLIHHTANHHRANRGGKVNRITVSANFKKCRDQVYQDHDWQGKTPPSFHELRSLSERLYKAQGVNTQALLGHKSAESTKTYHDPRQIDWVEIN